MTGKDDAAADFDKEAKGELTIQAEEVARQALERAGSTKSQQEPKAALFPIETEKLPSEKDRQCILGCLAVVLATGGTAHFVKEEKKLQSTGTPSVSGANDVDSFLLDDDSVMLNETETSSEKRQNGETENSTMDSTKSSQSTSSNISKDSREKIISTFRKRALAMRNNILRMSVDALLMDESVYASFLPILSFQSDSSSKEVGEGETTKAEMLRPFLENLSPGAGFATLALLLMRHLLTCASGYDARVRTAYLETAAEVLAFEFTRENDNEQRTGELHSSNPEYYSEAHLKFEALEAAVAQYLIVMAKEQNEREKRSSKQQKQRTRKESFIRAAKIGGAGVAAGALFAVTGGLAAPAIAAGVGAVTAGTAVAGSAAVVALSSSAAVTTLFGVGGGLMAANKMQRRVTGLTDFTIVQEKEERDLHATICVSGWLRDKLDFQRPWGVTPTQLTDPVELLKRFYAVFRPDYVKKVPDILKEWSGREKELWSILEDKYGRSPDALLPIYGPVYNAALSSKETDILADLLNALGYMKDRLMMHRNEQPPAIPASYLLPEDEVNENQVSTLPSASESETKRRLEYGDGYSVWDFSAEFGGEQYTIEWEGDLLLHMSDAARKFAKKFLAKYATAEVIKHTTLQALMSAVALPAALLSAASYMDSDWTLATERADEAGVELANVLVDEHSGDRPVTLVGFSLGARVVYSCLKQLGKLQIEWEKDRMKQKTTDSRKSKQSKSGKKGQDEQTALQPIREPASIVGDAVLLGLPYHKNTASWDICRQVVAGRLVNCYVPKDLVLLYLFNVRRLSSKVLKPVCGMSPVNVSGVENYNVEEIVTWHGDYCGSVQQILELIKHGHPRNMRSHNAPISSVEAVSMEKDAVAANSETCG